MTEIMIRLEQTEQEFVAFDVSDEALEAAAGTVKEANYTLAACDSAFPFTG